MDFENLHQILRSLYDEMMPLCEDMAGVAKGIAGLGALFYVAYRVWQSLARAEPIDVFPMLRPFAIGLCIMFFPTVVLGTLSGVLSPIVQGTAKMLETETLDMNEYREQKDKLEYEAMKRNPETAYLVSNEEFDKQLEELGWSPDDLVTMAGMYIERSMYQMKKGVRDFFRELLELLFQAAALVIDTLRTFFLVVLSILGPIAFAISVWDGFQSTLTQWICRYVQVYLWLPVSDMFSTILAKIGADAAERHRADAGRPELLAGFERWGVYRVHDHRHHRLLHHPHRVGLDYPGRGHGQLRAQREPDGWQGWRLRWQRGGCHRWQCGRTCRETAEIKKSMCYIKTRRKQENGI